jgi:hypothetical protein
MRNLWQTLKSITVEISKFLEKLMLSLQESTLISNNNLWHSPGLRRDEESDAGNQVALRIEIPIMN